MTNYNDGNWHGWNGGECPVHPKSKVEVVIRGPEGLVRLSAGIALSFRWESFRWEYLGGPAKVIAFRVVKEHREPREWWIYEGEAFLDESDAKFFCDKYGRSHSHIVHVREVLE